MSWRLAKSLEQLRSEVNTLWPNRSKASDGTIGDAAHGTKTDHYPNPQGVVCAFDLTHDPANGVDCNLLFAAVIKRRHPASKYHIWQDKVVRAYDKPGIPAWTVAPYTKGGHFGHMHNSVGVGPDGQSTGPYDIATPWLVGLTDPAQPEDDLTPEQDRLLRDIFDRVTGMHQGVTTDDGVYHAWTDKRGRGDLRTLDPALQPILDRLDAIEAKLK